MAAGCDNEIAEDEDEDEIRWDGWIENEEIRLILYCTVLYSTVTVLPISPRKCNNFNT